MGLLTDSLAPPDYGNLTQSGSAGLPMMAPPQAMVPAAPAMPMVDPSSAAGYPDAAYSQGGDNPSFLDKILNRTMPASRAYKGLLSPDEVTQARRKGLMTAGLTMLANSGPVNGQNAPSTAQALGISGMAGLNAYDQSQQDTLKQQMNAASMLQNQRIIQARSEAQRLYGTPAPGETQQQQLERQSAMGAYLASHGDFEGAKAVGEITAPIRMARAYGSMGLGANRIIQTAQGYAQIDPATGQAKLIAGPDGKPLMGVGPTEADRAAQRDTSQTNAAARLSQAADSHDMAYAGKFATVNKVYLDKAHTLQGSGAILNALGSADPNVRMGGLSSLAGAMANLEPSKPQLRAQLYDKLSEIDHSFAGHTQAEFSKWMSGQLPEKQVQMAQAFFNAVAGQERQNYTRVYEAAYNGRRSAQQLMGQYDPQALYGDTGAPAASGAPSAGPTASPAGALQAQAAAAIKAGANPALVNARLQKALAGQQ